MIDPAPHHETARSASAARASDKERCGGLRNVRVVVPGIGVHRGHVVWADGSIVACGEGEPPGEHASSCLDGDGALVSAGLIDLHTHGIRGDLFETGPDELLRACAILPEFGTTTVLPTILPRTTGDGLARIAALAEVLPRTTGSRAAGLHLEGPFLAISGAACETRAGDLGLLGELLAAGGGRVKAMSIAPEVPGIVPIIEALVAAGVVPFITHTRAGPDDALRAIAAGARHATHFYDVFPAPPETDPGVRPVGVVEAVLAGANTTCDFIADGVHVHPLAIRAAVAALGWRRVCLITDATFGAGLPPGCHPTSWGYKVSIKPGGAPRVDDPSHPKHGTLAGSALTMNDGLRNLLAWLALPADHVWAMATLNPAKVAGLDDRGSLRPGMAADLVLWDGDATSCLVPRQTWVDGNCVHRANETPTAGND